MHKIFTILVILSLNLFAEDSTDSLVIYGTGDISCGDSVWRPVSGGALYLMRGGVETHRAEFRYSEDCEYIASILSRIEPRVKWYCSTSSPILCYKCKVNNVVIVDIQKKDTTVENLEFDLSLNRKKARTFLKYGFFSFYYTETDTDLILKNDYLYASDNCYESAIYFIKIDKTTNKINIFDINNRNNGTGICEQYK